MDREAQFKNAAEPDQAMRRGSAKRPSPSKPDEASCGPENDFANRNTTSTTWNVMHFARMPKDAGSGSGPRQSRSLWDAGCRSDFTNPEYR